MAVMQQITTVSTVQSSRDWSTGLFDCFSDLETCCCGTWCLPCLQCQTVSRYGWCCLYPVLDGECMVVSCLFRQSMRDRYGIQGSFVSDCCALCFCYSCVWCQMSREVTMQAQRGGTTTVITQQVMS